MVSFLQTTTLMLSKMSLIILLHRIFVIPAYRFTLKILGAVVLCWWAAAFFGGAFICFPPSKLWDPSVDATCGNQQILDYATPIPWVLTDFAILISPVPVIKSLQVSRRKRAGLYAIFLMGGM